MTLDKCELCGQHSTLKKSHLMPKSIYKAITRTFHPYDSVPVWASKSQQSAYYSNSQITKKLLCGACEDRFNKYGEKYVVGMLMKNPQTFDLKRNLDSSSPSIHVNGFSYFAPKDIPKLNSEKLMYFAASIAWRVTAADWGNDDIAYLYNAIPDTFKYPLQQYLLKKAEFPENIYITVCIDDDTDPFPFMSLPTGDVDKDVHISFFIPGVKFNIFFGAEADPELASNLCSRGINMIYMYKSFRKSHEVQEMGRLVISELTPKGKLAKESGGV